MLVQWLKAAGHPVPPAAKANAELTYVGRMVEMPEDWEQSRLPTTVQCQSVRFPCGGAGRATAAPLDWRCQLGARVRGGSLAGWGTLVQPV
jgi:hypothetical protein